MSPKTIKKKAKSKPKAGSKPESPRKSAALAGSRAKPAARDASKPTAPRRTRSVGTATAKTASAKSKQRRSQVSRQKKARSVRRLPRRDLEHFRKLLVEAQGELTESYKVSKGESRNHHSDGTEDYIDYAVSSYAKEFLLSLSELDRKQLAMVEDALRRIDRGDYGFCQQCGHEIIRKRLEVSPWVRHCVRCQELEEQGLLPQFPYLQTEEVSEEDLAMALDEDVFEPSLVRRRGAEEVDKDSEDDEPTKGGELGADEGDEE